jgi:hypothetical protein
MGLMDKVKAQATQLAQKTQETAQVGKAKFDQAQANRRADSLLRNLGALVYAERTGRGSDDAQAQIEKLIGDISAHEAENGISLAQRADHGPTGGQGDGFPDAGAGAGAGAGAAAGASSFPDAGSASSFPDTPPTPSFPDGGSGSSFPDTPPTSSFPDAGAPPSFPDADPSSSFPDAAPPPSFPDAGGTES